MDTNMRLKDLKQQIAALIRSNSDRGFLHYSGCNRVCAELSALSEDAENDPVRRYAFDAQLLILLEAVKLISHADTSSGMVTDVINNCIHIVDQISRTAGEEERQYFFDATLKTVKNKAFKEWPEFGYALLRSTVYWINDSKQAEKVYALFPILGTMYSGEEYSDTYLIKYGIKQKLEGENAAEQYLMDNIEVDELRVIAIENAMQAKQYELAEQLCRDALKKGRWSSTVSKWDLYLERLYTETLETQKLIELTRRVLFQGYSSYYDKLKELYVAEGLWNEEMKASLLEELSKVLITNSYAVILEKEGEYPELLELTKKHPYLLQYIGKQIAKHDPVETSKIYEAYILEEAAAATDRRGYKSVCKLIKECADAVSKQEALLLLEKLSGMYPRRPAMQDELMKLKVKLDRVKKR